MQVSKPKREFASPILGKELGISIINRFFRLNQPPLIIEQRREKSTSRIASLTIDIQNVLDYAINECPKRFG
jgi:hypothetical protein